MVKNPPAMQETWVPSPDHDDPLEKGMTTQHSCLENPMDEEPGGLHSPWGFKGSDRTE